METSTRSDVRVLDYDFGIRVHGHFSFIYLLFYLAFSFYLIVWNKSSKRSFVIYSMGSFEQGTCAAVGSIVDKTDYSENNSHAYMYDWTGRSIRKWPIKTGE